MFFFLLTLDFEECWSSCIANFVFAHTKKSTTVLFTDSANGDVGDSAVVNMIIIGIIGVIMKIKGLSVIMKGVKNIKPRYLQGKCAGPVPIL